jgi:hypothetical protein
MAVRKLKINDIDMRRLELGVSNQFGALVNVEQ